MPTFVITAPDGRKFQVTGNGTKEDALAHIQQRYSGPDFEAVTAPTPAGDQRPELSAALERKAANADQRGSLADAAAQGFTFGTNDELSGVIGGVLAMTRGKTFDEGYDLGTGIARRNLAAVRRRHPVASTLAELAGGVGGVAPAILAAPEAAAGGSLLALAGRGTLAGAGAGAVYGAASADSEGGNGALADLANPERVTGAVTGAALGGATGGAFPVASAAVRGVARPAIDAVRARINPQGFAAEKVAERLASGNKSAGEAANRMARAASEGQRLSLADVGGGDVQSLARTAVNVPGPARNRITAKANLAQLSQGNRLKRAVGDLFADPEAYQATKEGIIAARASAAKPLYERAYAQPVPYTFDLENVLNTPAGKAALAGAKVNSANRREPWAQWFASIDDAGNVIDKRRVPDTRALDEVKRTLDRMVEEAKAPADGSPFAKARATPKSIAIQTVRDDLVKFIDKHNPAYAQARKAALDNIQADEALEFGRNALNTDLRVVAKKMAEFNDGQRELARIGSAEALRKKIDTAGFTHDAVRRIFNSRDQVKVLKALFGDTAEFNRFRSFIFNEARRTKTRTAVVGNSTTARQLADMQEAGQLSETAGAVTQAARGDLIGSAVSALQSGLRRLGGLTPQVADEIGKMLMTTDPAKVRQVLGQVRAIERARGNAENRRAAIRSVLTRFAGAQEGRAAGEASAAPAP